MTIQTKMLRGLNILMKHDAYILINNVNERTITHKLAEYYQNIFPGWNVDCEYNRNLSGPKNIFINPIDFLKRMANFIEEHYGDTVNLLAEENIEPEDIINLKQQLNNREQILYNDELDLIHFVLKLTNGTTRMMAIFPDIIIHHRGTINNYAVVEAKKSTNTDKLARLYDLVKIATLMDAKEYQYKYGFFVDIPCGGDVAKFKDFKITKTYNIQNICPN